MKAWDEKSYPEERDIIQHLFNVNYNNTKIFNFEFSVILSEELEWFQRLDHCVLNLLSSSNMKLNDWLNQTTDYTVWSTQKTNSLTCATLVCLSCEISVLCFINQGPQCRLVLLFNFLRNPEGQKEFGVPRAILFHQYSYCSELLKKFELEIFFYWYQRGFPQSPYIAIGDLGPACIQ